MCRLLPLWRDVLAEMDVAPRFVIVVRNPLEVAGSLERRNGFSFPKGREGAYMSEVAYTDACVGTLLETLKKAGKEDDTVVIVVGDHASNDMAGEEDDSWKVMLDKAGFTVKTDLRGLGMVDAWADIYVRHLADALAQTHLLP